MCDASLSPFPLGTPVNVCATLLWGQEGHVHWRVTACWICSPGPLSTASSSSEALDEIELLGSWLLAVWWHGWGCDNPGTLSELVSPRHYQYQQPVQIFRWASTTMASCFLNSLYYKEPLTPTVKCLLGGKISSLCNTACKQSTKSKKRNAIYPALNGGSFKRKGWQIQFCLLQPLPHYGCNTRVQTKHWQATEPEIYALLSLPIYSGL